MSEKTKQNPYPLISKYVKPILSDAKRKQLGIKRPPIVGREDKIQDILATFNRPRISNVALVGDAGTGKTTLVEAISDIDQTRRYAIVDLSAMAASEGSGNGATEMANRMTRLFEEVKKYQEDFAIHLVLFMDEFHALTEYSSVAVEAIKPILANSAENDIRVIVATTSAEFTEYIQPNEPLIERLQLVRLAPLSHDETISALQRMAKSEEPNIDWSVSLFEKIVAVTDSYLPSHAQPRVSINVLDAMIGMKRTTDALGIEVPKYDYDQNLLCYVMKHYYGVNIDYKVDAKGARDFLNTHVFDQTVAVNAIISRLFISMAKTNDFSKPRGTFLFTGSTGTGKTQMAKMMSRILYGTESSMIRFDMSEYSRPSSVDSFQKELTQAVTEKPGAIVLLDELEKAAPACAKLMLQAIDDARMKDRYGREVSFKDTYLIFTTNVGSKVFESIQKNYDRERQNAETEEELQTRQQKALEEYQPLIESELKVRKDVFPPELLGRFNQIVPFAPISRETRKKIFKLQMQQLIEQAQRENGVAITYDRSVIQFITNEHLGANRADDGGGREISRRIDHFINSKLAETLVLHPEYQAFNISTSGVFASLNKSTSVGSAQITIEPTSIDTQSQYG